MNAGYRKELKVFLIKMKLGGADTIQTWGQRQLKSVASE